MITRMQEDWPGSILIFSLLMGFWLLISASIDWQHLMVGFLLSFVLTILWGFLTVTEHRKTSISLSQLLQFIVYACCLSLEIVKANIHLAAIILNPKLPISPGMIILRCDLKKDLIKAFYANSITLTPGTISVELEGDLLIVHALTKDAALSLEEWYLYKKALQLEGGGKNG